MNQECQYSCASSLLTTRSKLCGKYSALGEDCFLNAVEDLSDYKENECTVEEPEINQSLVDPLLEQTSSDHKPASLAV